MLKNKLERSSPFKSGWTFFNLKSGLPSALLRICSGIVAALLNLTGWLLV